MKCPHCDHLLEDDSNFCNKCGQAITASADQTQVSKPPKSKGILIAGVIVLAVLISLFFLFRELGAEHNNQIFPTKEEIFADFTAQANAMNITPPGTLQDTIKIDSSKTMDTCPLDQGCYISTVKDDTGNIVCVSLAYASAEGSMDSAYLAGQYVAILIGLFEPDTILQNSLRQELFSDINIYVEDFREQTGTHYDFEMTIKNGVVFLDVMKKS